MEFIRCVFIFSRFPSNRFIGRKYIHSRFSVMQKHTEKGTEVEIHWWDSHRLLSRFNAVRVPFIQNGITATAMKGIENDRLDGVKILEVGCGGGILCEELAKLGADVVGLDIDAEVIDTAKQHQASASDDSIKNNLRYICESIYQYEKNNFEKYHSVVISEVIEHIPNEEKGQFLTSCINALQPGGSLFVTCPSRTITSRIIVVFLAELFSIIPKGTHNFDDFISIEDLIKMIKNRRCEIRTVEGIFYNPFRKDFAISPNKSMFYGVHALKLTAK